MNLRRKTFLIITAVFTIAFLVIAVTTREYLINGYIRNEIQSTHENVLQSQSALESTLANLDTTVSDWAEWDDTYQFIQDHNTAYIESNLIADTFPHRFSLIAFFDISGNPVLIHTYDPENGTLIPVSENLKNSLTSDNPLLIHSDADQGVRGILSLSDMAMLVVSHPILTSNGSGPAVGTLVFGQELNNTEMTRLAELTHLNISGYRLQDPNLPADFQSVLPQLVQDSSIVVNPIDKKNIAGYIVLKDIYNQPAFVMKVNSSRITYLQLQNDVFYFTLALLAFGLLFILVILLILEKMVISPVTGLSNRVSLIGQKGDLSTRIPAAGNNEIYRLAKTINGMLNNLEQSQRLCKESEAFNYALLQDSPNPIQVINPDTSIRYVNPALENITGYTHTQLLGRKPPYPWWPDDHISEYITLLQDTLSRDTRKREMLFYKPDNQPFWVEITSTTIKEEGKLKFLISNWVDITERKISDAALRESEKRFRELAELLPELVFETDLSGKLTFVNRVVFSVFGYPPEDHPELNLFDLLAIEDRDRAHKNLARILEGEELGNMGYTAVRKDGQTLPAFVHITPIKNARDEICGLRGILVDITVQKEIEDELRASEEFSSSLRDNSPYPIMVINPDTSIRYVNPALEMLTGFSASELVGCRLPYPFSTKEGTELQLCSVLTNNMDCPHRIEALFKKKSGDSFYVDINSTPVREGNHLKYVLSIWVDVTALKIANEQMEKLYQREKNLREALQAEIKSRTEYTRALVHELKTPLTPIMASSELLVEELTEEPFLSLAKNVFHGAENMNRRVNELLDLARGDVGMLTVNLNPLVPEKLLLEVTKYMELTAKNNGQSLILNIQNHLPTILADEDRVRQILFNLITNSIKYSNGKGNITITARKEAEYLIIEVQDTGRGMSEEEQQKLFQPYYRIEGKEHLSGLGLGLALSKKIVELHNGKIWVSSQKGKGSTFAFSLPLKNLRT